MKIDKSDYMVKMWMIRAGREANLINNFIDKNLVAIGWCELGNLSKIESKKELEDLIEVKYPKDHKNKKALNAGMIWKFIHEIKKGDYVVSYNPSTRKYHIGKIDSNYLYSENEIVDNPYYHNIRKVQWLGEVSRDSLQVSSRNTLGAIMTLFEIRNDVEKDLLNSLNGKKENNESDDEEDAEVNILKDDVINQSIEFIKDKIMDLNWYEMEELIAGLLRAMGYKTIISPVGPDKGKDIIASPDGLGLEDPKILVEVKHRNSSMGAPAIRNFLGVLQKNDKGLYVSTSGFTMEAQYEAERAQNPVTLMDIDTLVKFIIQYYDNFDNDARRLIPLTKIYWPI